MHRGPIGLPFWLARVAFLVIAVALPQAASTQTLEWIRYPNPINGDSCRMARGVTVDATAVYIVGREGPLPCSLSVQKFTLTGELAWSRKLASADFILPAAGAGVDSTGMYVAGSTSGILPGQSRWGEGSNPFVVKTDFNGNALWFRQFAIAGQPEPGIVGNAGTATGISVDSTGIYVVGSVTTDAFIRKYDQNGNELWSRLINFQTARGVTEYERAVAVATDTTGVYVLGYIWTFNESIPFIRKYDRNGATVWTSGPYFDAQPNVGGIAANQSGVFMAGAIGGDVLLRKYNNITGNLEWTRQFGTAGTIGRDEGLAVASDASGVYITGTVEDALPGQTSSGRFNAFLRKYDNSGAELWTQQFGFPFQRGHSVVVSSGAAYVAGDSDHIFLNFPSSGPIVGGNAFVAKLALPAVPALPEGAVVNAASFAAHPAPLAPGSIAVVFGSSLNNGSTVLSSGLDSDGKLLKTLGGATVMVNNIPAPILNSTPGQLGIQIPFELAGQTTATIRVSVSGEASTTRTIFLDTAAPGIFTLSQDGKGPGVIFHEDGTSLVTSSNPARPGEVVVMYGTGLGLLTPALATGALSNGNATTLSATVALDGVAAEVEFSGAAPGFAGLNQVNFRVPLGTRSASDIPVVLRIGGKTSNTVTIAVAP
jgi:uncharacterized protein (TIGR03437 family)